MSKFFFTIRSRLMLIVLLTALPGILLLWLTGLEQRQHAVQDTEDEIVSLAKVATKMQSELIYNVESFLQTLAHLPTIRAEDMTGCQEILSHLVGEHFNYYSSFYVADLQGNILCSPPGMHTPPDFDLCNHYKNLVNADDFVFSGYHICRHTGKAVFSIGYPIYNLQNERILVSNVSLDLIWFYDFAAEINLPEGAELIVIDQGGKILSHYPDNDKWRGSPLLAESGVSQIFQQKSGTHIGANFSGQESLFAISSIASTTQTIYVVLGIPTSVAFAVPNQTLQRNMTIMIATMVGVLTLMWLLGDVLITKQTRRLVAASQELAHGNLAARSSIAYNQGEMGQVARAFDDMAADLAKREEVQARHVATLSEYALNLEHSNEELVNFTNIASHDLQEPLRKIQTFGELLQDRHAANLNPQAQDYIQRMRDAAHRMQALISEMMSYSQVTGRKKKFVQVNLSQVVQQVLTDLDWQIESKQARIETSRLPTIEADPIQINQLLQNLISNALKFHAHDKPPVIHIYSPYPNGKTDPQGMVEIRIQDEGIGFKEKYLERIFQPFQRLNTNEYEGAGMGLTICRKIVDHHGGKITAHSIPGKGTTFIILLPKTQRNDFPEQRT